MFPAQPSAGQAALLGSEDQLRLLEGQLTLDLRCQSGEGDHGSSICCAVGARDDSEHLLIHEEICR